MEPRLTFLLDQILGAPQFILFLALSVACSGETEEDDDDDEESIAPVGAVVTVDVGTDDDLHLAV